MPFLGQDWRSPGGCWVKSENGWKRSQFYREEESHRGKQLCPRLQEESNENKIVEDCEVIAKKRKKDHFNINTRNELIEDQQNPRLIKNLLQDLGSVLCILIREVGRCVLVGNVNIWVYRMETILDWQHQLNNLKITRRICNGVTLSDLPLHMQRSILHRFSDGLDIISLGQVTSTLHMLSEDRHLWKKLCQYHFAEKQFCRHLILTENGCVDWKLMYFTLQKYCPKKEQYGDVLQFCRHCSILFWKDTGHPCTANNPESCCTPVSPQHFIDLFKF
ncbi:F-box only protein 25 [Pristis pectinata]|uniref:F-box only protein 25 n=1 Tax=Pristis pectinata TaxID=685728 RepID=UPI00223D7B6A|nr:F-box only protein 25 [Pristis pectinata]